ncbi:hypothetical protein EDEG_03265 [Edhazardia aedis USNM 41457]|uniref:Transmembrane protein n=1 Tax=Edhazardia aedis (strain USNM 41457) TaxID=1003232 RepID=J9D388_EDHAE|nr:hypothetical protein EDEG_03265 [Edhazardia aedis USNM 41457]|eukprot:EJW02301.1 hypothetical protein EDEG_03265 [Edhazardia aedis USNM 41457]
MLAIYSLIVNKSCFLKNTTINCFFVFFTCLGTFQPKRMNIIINLKKIMHFLKKKNMIKILFDSFLPFRIFFYHLSLILCFLKIPEYIYIYTLILLFSSSNYQILMIFKYLKKASIYALLQNY